MLNIFSLANGRLVQEEIESLEELARFQPIWVDLESPTLQEKRWITLRLSTKAMKIINRRGLSAVVREMRANGQKV